MRMIIIEFDGPDPKELTACLAAWFSVHWDLIQKIKMRKTDENPFWWTASVYMEVRDNA